MLKNARGKYCYRYKAKDKWFLSSTFTPDKAGCWASILAKEGPLPVGAHTWQVWMAVDGKWESHTLTAALLVGSAATAAIVAKEGPLPVGAHAWQYSSNDDWEEHTLTVTLQPTQPQ